MLPVDNGIPTPPATPEPIEPATAVFTGTVADAVEKRTEEKTAEPVKEYGFRLQNSGTDGGKKKVRWQMEKNEA